MAINSSVNSNAMNFLSFMKGGVDPRTGQYTMSISLPDLVGNGQLEHPLKLQLDFNPLNRDDSGYGNGWNLNLSQYSASNQRLSLSTGESFSLGDSSSGQRLFVEEQKLPSFNVYKEGKHDLDRIRRLRVMHRSGLVEILEFLNAGEGEPSQGVALPVEIHSPQGHRLYLTYKPFVGNHHVLDTVTDGEGELLFKCTRSRSAVELLVYPVADTGVQPLARYSMTLESKDNRVKTITLPGGEAAIWDFSYRPRQGLMCLDTIRNPTGAIEQLFYEDNGHQFPHDKTKYLPRVTRHLTEPRFGQKPIDVRFTYDFIDQGNIYRQHSFIGSGTNIGWSDSGRDNLYEYRDDYEYRSEEQLWVDGKVVRSIERRFNRIHLQTAEITRQGNSVVENLTDYVALGNRHFRDLPATCQLPLKETRRWRMLDNSLPPRSEWVENTYDKHGNLRTRTFSTGAEEHYEWYPATGDDDCPADPEGFVRHLKEKITKPATVADKTALPQCERYIYITLPRLADPEHDQGNPDHDWHKQPWHATYSEVMIEQGKTEQLLRQTIYHYANSVTDPFLHGRRYLQQQLCNGLQTATEWHYTRVPGPGLDKQVLQTEEVLRGYDGTRRSTLEQRSLLHGKHLLIRDANGVDLVLEYDRLMRLKKQTVAPDSKFEAVREYAYTLFSGGATQTSQAVTDARGITTVTLFDGLARAVEERRDNVYEGYPLRLHTTQVVRHDEWGRRASQTRYDWLPDQGERALTEHFEYDEWGELCCTIGPTDVDESTIGPKAIRHYQVVNPLGSREHPDGAVLTTWRQVGTGKDARVSDWQQAWQNPYEKPLRTLALDEQGQPVTLRRYSYDGWNRCVSETDERNFSTTYGYDAWGRLTTTTLPEKTRIERAYALHTEAELATSLTVFPANINEPTSEIALRRYDGLDRVSFTRTGPRTEYLHYQGGETQPREHISAAGVSTRFEYELALTTEPTGSVTDKLSSKFTFHEVSARLNHAGNGDCDRDYEYNLANQVTVQRWYDHKSRTRLSRTYRSSVDDRLVQSTEDNRIVTRYLYDRYARLERTEKEPLHISHAYDDFGRPSSTTTLDGSGNYLKTEIFYDHRDREICRSWELSGKKIRMQTQEWGPDDLLKSRELSEDGKTLLKEVFNYDPRSRLISCICTGTQLPRDELNRPITSQIFTTDAYDNISMVMSTYADGHGYERAMFIRAADDPCQLRRIEYTPARATGNPTFRYDANGSRLNDERGQVLSYDNRNRLLSVGASHYRYDGFDRLFARQDASGADTVLLFEGNRLHRAVRGSLEQLYCYQGEVPLAQQSNDGQAPLLLQTSASHSVIAESLRADRRDATYGAYGTQPYQQDAPLRTGLGYNGEMQEPDSGLYLLGGLRPYSTVTMDFGMQDPTSPLDNGELSYYGYCRGNPIMLRDPTGTTAIGWSGRLREVYEDDPANGTRTSGNSIWELIGAGVAVVASFIAITIATVVTYGAAAKLYALWALKSTAIMTSVAIAQTAVVAAAAVGKTIAATVATTVAALTVTSTAYQIDALASGSRKSNRTSLITGSLAGLIGITYFAAQGISTVATAYKTLGSWSAAFRAAVNKLAAPFRAAERLTKATTSNLAGTADPLVSNLPTVGEARKFAAWQVAIKGKPYDGPLDKYFPRAKLAQVGAQDVRR